MRTANVSLPAWLRKSWVLFALIALIAFLMRLIGLEQRWLWFDELLSVTFSAHDLWNTLVTNFRFDIHPPLYYLQLNLWSVFGRSDLWLMLNSVTWSVAAVVLLMARAARLQDRQTALIAGLLLALSPMALVYGDQVRMYSFLMVLILWIWIALDEWLKAADQRRLSWAVGLNVIASQIAVIYAHSAGIVMISGCVLYAGAELWRVRDLRVGLYWVGIEAIVSAIAVPALAIAAVRSAGHPVAPNLRDILQTWCDIAAGALGQSAAGVLAGLLLFAVLIYICVTDRASRTGVLTLIFAPLVIAAAISHLIKPIWLDRIFITTAPFICFYVAISLRRWLDQGKVMRAAVTAFLVVWAAIGFGGQMMREKGDGYRPAALYVRQAAAPGDIVLVDGDFAYWCFMWYFAGPDWGRPQQAYVMMPKWQHLSEKMGPALAQALGFGEQNRSVERDGVDAIMWDRNAPEALPDVEKVLVVRTASSPALSVPGYELSSTQPERDLVVETWRRAAPR